MLLLVLGVMIALICMASALRDSAMAAAVHVFSYDRRTQPMGITFGPGNCVIQSRHYASQEEEQARLYTMNPKGLVELITVNSAVEDAGKH